ncbi:MAG TPA: hypothetical protein VHG91_14385 [Longimicrobium sp.]|nr:hypothetical protein [Longimicrobium sp.]
MHYSNTRHPLVTRIVSPILLGALAFSTGCAGDLSAPTESVAEVARYDGETLLRGIFFGQGPVAGLLPELWEGRSVEERAQTPERAAQVRKLQDAVVARIAKEDPSFFGRFESAVRSGDHLAIEAALQDAAKRVKLGLTSQPLYETVREAEAIADPVVDIEIAIYAVLVVVVFLIDFAPIQRSPGSVSGLERDKLVDLLAVRVN